jgi:hypothetical protein
MERGSKQPSQLSESLCRQLNSYALTASAAGVSLLGLAQPSEARIVYTKAHDIIGTRDIYPLDLNHDGIIDFLIQERGTSVFSGSVYNGLFAKEAYGNAVAGKKSHRRLLFLAAALAKGATIGPGRAFVSSTNSDGEIMLRMACGESGCSTVGQWANLENRYLGLKFQINRETHYGWARFSVRRQGYKITATLTGYAYETIANRGIDAGQTERTAADPNVENPSTTFSSNQSESGDLGHLARGAQPALSGSQPW